MIDPRIIERVEEYRAQEGLRHLLRQGAESGPGSPADDDYFAELRRRALMSCPENRQLSGKRGANHAG